MPLKAEMSSTASAGCCKSELSRGDINFSFLCEIRGVDRMFFLCLRRYSICMFALFNRLVKIVLPCVNETGEQLMKIKKRAVQGYTLKLLTHT